MTNEEFFYEFLTKTGYPDAKSAILAKVVDQAQNWGDDEISFLSQYAQFLASRTGTSAPVKEAEPEQTEKTEQTEQPGSTRKKGSKITQDLKEQISHAVKAFCEKQPYLKTRQEVADMFDVSLSVVNRIAAAAEAKEKEMAAEVSLVEAPEEEPETATETDKTLFEELPEEIPDDIPDYPGEN